MKTFITACSIAMMSSSAWASAPAPQVPEMGAGAGLAAIGLLVGIAALIREKSNRK